MRTTTAIIFSLVLLSASGQNRELNFLSGFWIAEEYSNSFEKTKSALLSKDAFDPTDPVALGITYEDSASKILKIDHYSLHDHRIFSETAGTRELINHSGYLTNYFTVDLSKSDSSNCYPTGTIFHFSYDSSAVLSWETFPDTVVILHKPASVEEACKTIRYSKMHVSIQKKDQLSNPLYCYTRSITLAGTFTLQDGLGKVLSKHFSIRLDGTTSGYPDLISKRLYFSTDIYCADLSAFDTVLICEQVNEEFVCENLIYMRKDEDTILLLEMNEKGTIDQLKFELVRK